MKTFIILLLSFASSGCFGQVQSYYVTPFQTDINYATDQDSSTISINTGTQQGKLYLFLGGTGSSSSSDYNAVRLHAANLGFHFINLSYLNTVAAASLSDDTDISAFDNYRQEICFGTPLSPDVSVDTLNAIYTRTLKLVQYLDANNTSENWGQFLATSNTLDWSKIIVGGHSQGSGHAAYLAKQFAVDRVLMFSGPNDYSDFFSGPATWLTVTGITPTLRHFSYLSLNDEIVDYEKQHANNTGLGMHASYDSTYIDNLASPYGLSHCLYTTQAPGFIILNHNVTVKLSSINNDVWTYMLTDPNVTGIENQLSRQIIEVYPNPTTDNIYLKSEQLDPSQHYEIFNLAGQVIQTGKLAKSNNIFSIDLSTLKAGSYILKIDEQAIQVLKQ